MRERHTESADLELNVQVGIEIEKERCVGFCVTVKDGTGYIYRDTQGIVRRGRSETSVLKRTLGHLFLNGWSRLRCL
jgi:hypothetical protein